MDLKQLHYFIRTLECGSISRAARALNIAQPSLSERISMLESELGAKLLLRLPSGVKPTETGLIVAERGRALLRGAENLVDEARMSGMVPVGTVGVGLPLSVALHLTVPLALNVREHYPQVNLHISEGMSGHILEWMMAGRLDMAIIYVGGAIAGVETEVITREDLSLISSPNCAVPDDTVPMKALCDYPIVLPGRDHGLRRAILREVEAAGAELNVTLEVDSLASLKRLSMEGHWHTILPAAACAEEIRAGRLVARRIIDPTLRRAIVMATPRDRPLTLAGEKVRDLLVTLVREAVRS